MMKEADGIMYDPPHLASPTDALIEAVRELKSLPQTFGRQQALAEIEEELRLRESGDLTAVVSGSGKRRSV
ncbi:hypothetical protein VB618_09775 [Microvirga sp. CF3062]|uniref:hypothetical protein n=1 Tax=Microvirga sp. CF3062 TaxID=3110182 RepID=UPI002E7AA08C|nr:hypothetical protein [Microvirga sp. CF3062]MEE1656486.1 hypothetical protein [Microvirga sp. CF3062]